LTHKNNNNNNNKTNPKPQELCVHGALSDLLAMDSNFG